MFTTLVHTNVISKIEKIEVYRDGGGAKPTPWNFHPLIEDAPVMNLPKQVKYIYQYKVQRVVWGIFHKWEVVHEETEITFPNKLPQYKSRIAAIIHSVASQSV